MSELCDAVTERIALGEPLGELRDHVDTCTRCNHTLLMPSRIAAATERASGSDPGLGFAARMTIGAQHKLVRRRQHRIVATAGTSVAAAALAVFALTRSSPEPENKPAPALETKLPVDDKRGDKPERDDKAVPVDNAELVQLVNLSDTKRAARESARWGRIRKPLRPYIQLVKGVQP